MYAKQGTVGALSFEAHVYGTVEVDDTGDRGVVYDQGSVKEAVDDARVRLCP